jgi:excisionase family DNA binding protein
MTVTRRELLDGFTCPHYSQEELAALITLRRRATRPERPSIPHADEEPFLNLKQAASWLGLSKTNVYRLVRDGQFPVPVVRFGGVLRVRTVDLRRFAGLAV